MLHIGMGLRQILTNFLNERQRHKLLGGLGVGSLGNFLDFNSIESSFLGF